MQAVEREAPGDVRAASSSSLAVSQFLPILEESRSPSADARALAPFKGNWLSCGSARARELSLPPILKSRTGPGPGKPQVPCIRLPNLSALHTLWGHFNRGERRPGPCHHYSPPPSPHLSPTGRLFFRRRLGRKQDARPRAFGDPLLTRPQLKHQVRTSLLARPGSLETHAPSSLLL